MKSCFEQHSCKASVYKAVKAKEEGALSNRCRGFGRPLSFEIPQFSLSVFSIAVQPLCKRLYISYQVIKGP